jgi:hypothetical protein
LIEVKQAMTLLDDLLKIPTPHHFEHTMKANQGLICNNILHNRSAFVDDPQHPRLLLRGHCLSVYSISSPPSNSIPIEKSLQFSLPLKLDCPACQARLLNGTN